MEFDLHTLRPTYHLTIGLPGRSNALLIAERLGLPQGDHRGRPQHARPERPAGRGPAGRDPPPARPGAPGPRRRRPRPLDAEKLRSELAARLEKIEDERQAAAGKGAPPRPRAELVELRAELEEVRRALSRARQPLEALKPVQEQVDDLRRRQSNRRSNGGTAEQTPARPLRLGDKVRVRSLGMEGVVTAHGRSDVEVQIGNLRVRARLGDIQRAGDSDAEHQSRLARKACQKIGQRQKRQPHRFYPSPGMELDLRGQRAEDALDALDRYLESAFLAGLPFVRIIHGKGTGRLRQVVREALQGSPHVSRWENGQDKEGGEGVTVAHLHKE